MLANMTDTDYSILIKRATTSTKTLYKEKIKAVREQEKMRKRKERKAHVISAF